MKGKHQLSLNSIHQYCYRHFPITKPVYYTQHLQLIEHPLTALCTWKQECQLTKKAELKLKVTPWLHWTKQKLCSFDGTRIFRSAFGPIKITKQTAHDLLPYQILTGALIWMHLDSPHTFYWCFLILKVSCTAFWDKTHRHNPENVNISIPHNDNIRSFVHSSCMLW